MGKAADESTPSFRQHEGHGSLGPRVRPHHIEGRDDPPSDVASRHVAGRRNWLSGIEQEKARMNTSLVDGYRGVRKSAIALALGAAVTLGGVLGALAADGTFDDGGQVKSSGYEEYEYAAAPYEVEYDGYAYTYGTGTDGKGSYVTYDGSDWSEYYTWEDQPADYQYQPTGATYGESQYVVYNGVDSKYYLNSYDGSEWAGWNDISGEYEFEYAPYVNTYDDN